MGFLPDAISMAKLGERNPDPDEPCELGKRGVLARELTRLGGALLSDG